MRDSTESAFIEAMLQRGIRTARRAVRGVAFEGNAVSEGVSL